MALSGHFALRCPETYGPRPGVIRPRISGQYVHNRITRAELDHCPGETMNRADSSQGVTTGALLSSFASVALTTVAITVNHLYALGPKAFVLGATLLVLSGGLVAWFARTRRRVALAGYLLVNL